ncbi:MAG: Fe-S cluster assembly protein SufD [Euryarchaeota archaeon]|jgi:Fe-S cluster assembly protein SufD|nr:Fe-S cluster assembly protein SufD [Euryarchaeota archaeon]MDP6364139.1 Fe-S cluster assembly protein SufD [Candidatus Poseidoniia archaeon]MDP6658709.1 Fe-S cluster assembly protein SufD [Candidatus Poseidoniia archaeon]MDP6846273.1 Fe-S cluster assembly protein SufD [Candidatus Poseidoniia archaeon]MDP7007020.1 Fe-S cluster assembly protein SufD [Candidatus Poseidoniia archaeon]|tara:strand:+ start:2802 stop:3956 length:1155 start_codon:yes stop_codon:yes gene_type:complete
MDWQALLAAADGPPGLAPLRKAAGARFLERGLPSPRDEGWRYTDTRFFAKQELELARPAIEIDAPAGVRVRPLGEAVDAAQPFLADEAQQEHPFRLLNAALLHDGLLVEVADGATPDGVLRLTITTAQGLALPRLLVAVGENARLTLVERYRAGSGACLPVTQLAVGAGSRVEHLRVHHSREDVHIGCVEVRQQRNSLVASHMLTFGGKLVRNDLAFHLLGRGAEARLNGLYLADGEQHVDNHTTVEHAVPHCDSRETYRGILGGKASAVFNGRVHVHPDAQRTDAQQSNQNLLLTDDAVIHTKPELEIYADDVKCTHGATVGQLDREALFYLRSRGLAHDEARRMLVDSFAAEIVRRISDEPLRDELAEAVVARLPGMLAGAA